MWFKNLVTYQFSKPFEMSGIELEETLKAVIFRKCGAHDMSTYGFVPALGAKTNALVHSSNGCLLVCARKEEKILPTSVVRVAMEEKIDRIEMEQDRTVYGKEKRALKDDVMLDLLPKAFTKSNFTQAYIDPVDGWLVVNAASFSQAEELTSLLRKALGSLAVATPGISLSPSNVLTNWLLDDFPCDFVPGNACEIKEFCEDGLEIKARHIRLPCESIGDHLENGMKVTSLNLTWDQSIEFTLNDRLQIKKIKYTDLIQEKMDETETETVTERMDADFSLMVLTFRLFLKRLFLNFQGELELDGQ